MLGTPSDETADANEDMTSARRSRWHTRDNHSADWFRCRWELSTNIRRHLGVVSRNIRQSIAGWTLKSINKNISLLQQIVNGRRPPQQVRKNLEMLKDDAAHSAFSSECVGAKGQLTSLSQPQIKKNTARNMNTSLREYEQFTAQLGRKQANAHQDMRKFLHRKISK